MTAPEVGGRVVAVCAMCDGPMPRHGRSPLYCTTACRDKAKRRRAKGRKPLPPPAPPSVCVRCGKVACPTEAAAKEAKAAVQAKTGRVDEVRYYQCPDGWWHWTRVDASLDGWRARRAPATRGGGMGA